MSIFPFLNGTTETATTETKPPKEYAWDFENNDFLLKDGKFIVVEGLEAIKVWVYKTLLTQRYKYLAYSWDYGNELESIIGQSQLSNESVQSEVQRYINESLLVNKNIKQIKNLTVSFDGDSLSTSFTIVTDYGEADINV